MNIYTYWFVSLIKSFPIIIDIGNVIKKNPNKIKKLSLFKFPSSLMLAEEANIITGIKKGITIINWINLFLLICKENSAEINDKRTNVGDDSKKIKKTVIVVEKLIPNKREVRGIKKKLEKIIDENMEKLLAKKINSGEKPRNWSSLSPPFLKSSSIKLSEVKISENKMIINKIGR